MGSGRKTYTGDVTVGGPAAVRELPGLTVRKASVSEQDNNAYLLTCTVTGEQLLVDAADDPGRILAMVHEGTGRLGLVVTTHRHWDHHRALASVVALTGAATAAGAPDADGMPLPPDRQLHHGEEIRVGSAALEVIHLRGHTAGSVALAYVEPDGGPTHLFTGDSLFPGGVGNTWGDAGAFASLIADVEARVFARFDDRAWVYPGHGNDTTLGAERPHLAEWRARGW